MSRYLMIAIIVLTGMFAPLAATAADVEGKVQSVDVNERSFTLDNGTKIWLSDAVAVDSIKEGAEVTVSYEERDGKPVATSVTTK